MPVQRVLKFIIRSESFPFCVLKLDGYMVILCNSYKLIVVFIKYSIHFKNEVEYKNDTFGKNW